MLETIKIYHNEKIETFDELIELMSRGAPACHDAPEKDRCGCKSCFEYEITFEKIKTWRKE